ncbi:hypothetical protein [Altererythrobacter sp. TH136]|uniref:hypothetical protein n=1 Tax=Altererythrobacter sp. TH136 TaxID=2067415 RepID=UPI00116315C2|nr:hypothetical protein [Altererythrobacter sp. TH136]QDM40647.1 hypothetical protein C0V74_06015 [Altererythrobacter sp. TH136]
MEKKTLVGFNCFRRNLKDQAGSFRVWSQTLDERLARSRARREAKEAEAAASGPKLQQPTLIIRLMPAVYRPIPISVRVGTAAVSFGLNVSFVQHPKPFDADGRLAEDCRRAILKGALEASEHFRMRMCLQWAEGESTYVEPDGSYRDFDAAPGRGLKVGLGCAI